jgi:hypothetical protein
MPTHDSNIILESLSTEYSRLCFYPSCGKRSPWVVASLDADVFVFSDKFPRSRDGRQRFWHDFKQGFSCHKVQMIQDSDTIGTRFFRFGDKYGILFFQDNNQTLELIHNAGRKITKFVGICDGCNEGGNYECIHDEPFLSKVLTNAADGMEYITDHSRFLSDYHGGKTKFSLHAQHHSGWEFTLESLLFRDLQDSQDPYKILRFPDRQRIPTVLSNISLARLLPMRENYGSAMLAQYRIDKITSLSLNELSSQACVLSVTGQPYSEPSILQDGSDHDYSIVHLPTRNTERAAQEKLSGTGRKNDQTAICQKPEFDLQT